MSARLCTIPGNPDIAGFGVRIAIYIQNLLCFLPAFWALFDGKVTQGELAAAETQATTNLVLAFAILISSIVQAQTLGLTNYHASIVLNMSWMNNTNAFIYFLLYIQHKSQLGIRNPVKPTWRAWIQHIRELAVAIAHPGAAQSNPASAGSDPEIGQTNGADAASIRSGVERVLKVDVQGNDDYARAGAKLLVKRFVLLLGSLHLSLMAALGLWLWGNIRTFGEGQDAANDCAAKHALLAILGKHVPFASEALRIVSLAIYAVFLVPGVNLLLPIALFIGLYHLHHVSPVPTFAGSGATPDSFMGRSRFRFWIRRAHSSIVNRWGILPPFIGLIFLLTINLVFIIDIELALKQNEGLQSEDETEWGFGQILAMLLLFMPLRDLAETFLARRMKQRQKDLDMGLGGAINANDGGMVLTWISRGANPNAKLEGDICPMYIACYFADLDIIKTLLGAGADPNIKDGYRRDMHMVARDNTDCLRLLNKVEEGSLDGVKALVQAAENGYGAAVRLLLPYSKLKFEDRQIFFEALSGLNVNARNTFGTTALFSALSNEQDFEAVIKFLLTAPGIDVKPPKNARKTPLCAAAEKGYQSVVGLLLAMAGNDVNAPDTRGRTPLSLATENGHEAVVELLLTAHGIDVNAPDDSGRTPLSFAAEKNHEAILGLLLTAPGIDVNAPDARGRTPLSLATENGHEAVVELLLTAPEIDVNAPDTSGKTPLRFAAREGREALVKVLLAAPGIEVNAPDPNGWTPLIFAAIEGHKSAVKLLLAAPGIDVNAASPIGATALRCAAEHGNEAVVKLLIVAPRIDINVPDTDGRTALSFAAEQGNEAVVELLLATPAVDANAADNNGWTPLMLAARYGLEAVAKLLLTAPGINVNAADTGGRTALTWAVFAGKEAIVLDLCAVPEIIVDVADVKRRLEHPPKGWPYGTRILKDKQDKCVRILEEFAGSNGGGAQDGAVSEKPGGG